MRAKKPSQRRLWYWACHWDTSHFGCFDADYDSCGMRSRKGWTAEGEAKSAASRHEASHGHEGCTQVYRQREDAHAREGR